MENRVVTQIIFVVIGVKFQMVKQLHLVLYLSLNTPLVLYFPYITHDSVLTIHLYKVMPQHITFILLFEITPCYLHTHSYLEM